MAQGTKQKQETHDEKQTKENEQKPAGSTSQSLAPRGSQHMSGRSQFNSPYSLFDSLRNEMDQLFDDFGFGQGILPMLSGRSRGMSQSETGWKPQTEVFERDNNLIVRADLPGLKKEDLNVEVEHDRITIRGERKSEHNENKEGVYRTERNYGTFLRSIPVPDGADGDNAKAEFHDGVLEITMPISEPKPKAKKLEIR